MEIRLIEYNSPDYEKEVDLRRRILREPLGLKFSAGELEAEFADTHLGAFDDAGKLVGCLVLKPVSKDVVKMRQVAVEPELQGKGIGRQMVIESEKTARSLGYTAIILFARDTAVEFYNKLNYKVEGDMFFEVTIPHYKMTKDLYQQLRPNNRHSPPRL